MRPGLMILLEVSQHLVFLLNLQLLKASNYVRISVFIFEKAMLLNFTITK